MKLNKRQLRKLVLKEFLQTGRGNYQNPPPIDRGDGGNSCEEWGSLKYNKSFNIVLNEFNTAFEHGVDLEGAYIGNHIVYINYLRRKGVPLPHFTHSKEALDYVIDGIIPRVSIAHCKGHVLREELINLFNNPLEMWKKGYIQDPGF